MTTNNGLHLRIYSTGDEVTIADRGGEVYAKLYGPYRYAMAIGAKMAIAAAADEDRYFPDVTDIDE